LSRREKALFGALVVSGGGFQGLALIRSLRESESVRVIVADVNEDHVGGYLADRSRRVPRIAEGRAFVDALVEICRAEAVRVVFAATDHELEALAESRERLESLGARVAVPSLGFLGLARDKRRLHGFLARCGLPALPLLDPRAEDLPFPLFGRPVSGFGGHGVMVLQGPDERAAKPMDELAASHVWQRRLASFDELSVDFAVAFDGSASDFGIRRRVRTSGGFAVISDDAPDEAVRSLMRPFADHAARAGALGPMNVQLLVADGRILFSDLNPRLGTSAVHWLGTGFNPVLHVCAALDPCLAVAQPGRLRGGPRRRVVRVLEELQLEADERPAERAVRGVVFDLDDTLVDHREWVLAKLEGLHAALASELPERRAFLLEAMRALEEGARAELLDLVARRLGLDSALRDRMIEAYRQAAPPTCALRPGALTTLVELRRRGFRLALLTDNPRESQGRKLEAAGLAPYLDAVVYARDSGAEKPDRSPFEAVAAALGLAPATLAMVGDNPYRDVAGALAAGYATAYLVAPSRGLCSFDADVFGRLYGGTSAFRTVDHLRSLLWYLTDRADSALDSPESPG
jgi:FMN phosphatase YigB (HAD superfamily)